MMMFKKSTPTRNNFRILGVDPGYDRVGFAVIEKNNGKEKLIYSSCLETNRKASFSERILEIGQTLEKLIKKYKPDTAAVESLFLVKNQKTVMRVSEARGVILYALSKKHIPVTEVTPLQIKVALTGFGKSDKDQVIYMVKQILPEARTASLDDEFDAIATALTCSQNPNFK